MTNPYMAVQVLLNVLFRQQIAKGIVNLQNHVVGGGTYLATGLRKVYIYIYIYIILFLIYTMLYYALINITWYVWEMIYFSG